MIIPLQFILSYYPINNQFPSYNQSIIIMGGIPGLIIFLTLIPLCYLQQNEAVNWPYNAVIKSGEQKLLLLQTAGPTSLIYDQLFNITFTTTPIVGLSMIRLQVNPAIIPIGFSAIIQSGSINQTRFSTNLTVYNSTTIIDLLFMYIGMIPASVSCTIYPIQNSISTNGSLNLVAMITQNTSVSYDLTHKIVVQAFITGFLIQAANTQLSAKTTGQMSNASAFTINITSNSTLSYIELHVFIIDKTNLQKTYSIYLDEGGYQSQFNNAVIVNGFRLVDNAFNYYNFIGGFTWFAIPSNQSIISFYAMNTGGVGSAGNFNYLNFQLIHWRFRQCPTLQYYLVLYQRCYNTCPTAYANNSTFNVCMACPVSCDSCDATGTICFTCPANSSRVSSTTNGSCPCLDGFYDNGFTACATCSYTCLTCLNSSTICQSCVSGRLLTSNACPCLPRTYDPQTMNSTCLNCHSTCLSCNGSLSNNCLACNTTANRIFDSSSAQCLCASGTQPNSNSSIQQCVAVAFTCNSTCLTCSLSANNCTSCDSTRKRTLSGSLCICLAGYQSVNNAVTCTQICGKGYSIALPCDDGNAASGDGCSSACQIQSGYNCTVSSSSPSICINTGGYTIALVSVQKLVDSNNVVIDFKISPAPPSGSKPSLLTYTDSLSFISSSQSGQIVSITFAVKKELSSMDYPQISFSLINLTGQAQMISENKLLVRPYSSSQYTLYTAIKYLVWIYIGLLWVGSIIFIAFVQYKLLGSVIQLFFYSGMAWIAVMGLNQYGLFYLPLINLKYVFGFNLTMGNQAVFDVLNVGLAVTLLPLITYLVSVFISKKFPHLLNTSTKRMILFDLTYVWLMVDGFMVVYGLGLTNAANYNISTLKSLKWILSVVFGLLYIVLMFGLSYLFFFKAQQHTQLNPKLQTLKSNVFRPKFLPIYYISCLLVSLIYLQLRGSISLNALIPLGLLSILFIVVSFANLYINKIRHLLNILSLIFIYGCVLLFSQVTQADWTGMLIVALIYVQLIVNFTFMVMEGKKGLAKLAALQKYEQSPTFQNRMSKDSHKLSNHSNRNDTIPNNMAEDEQQNVNNISKHSNQSKNQSKFSIYEPPYVTPIKQNRYIVDDMDRNTNFSTNKRFQTTILRPITSPNNRDMFHTPASKIKNQIQGQALIGEEVEMNEM